VGRGGFGAAARPAAAAAAREQWARLRESKLDFGPGRRSPIFSP
jgi:hypothetical protein